MLNVRDKNMKWMIATILTAVANVVIIMLFAASKLGRMPVLLPLILAILSLCCAIVSLVMGIVSKKRQHPQWVMHLISAAMWTGLIAFNFWAFQSVLYVA
jgi:hypothetical protein